MAFSLEKIVLLLSMLVFALPVNLGFMTVTAVPTIGQPPLDMTKSLNARNASMEMNCPAGQPPDQAGCSTCTECCIFQFNDAGCGEYSVEEIVVNDYSCHSLWIGMNNVWISECTGSFGECMLWSNPDCTGDGSWGIANEQDDCHHTQYWIKSIQCYESDGAGDAGKEPNLRIRGN